MVRTRGNEHSDINIERLKDAINDIFGRTLTIRVVSETVDAYGQLTAVSTADTTFTGDLQYGPYLDERLLSTGWIEYGDAVLYIYPGALTTNPVEQDIIIDGNTGTSGTYHSWEIVQEIEAPELGGVNCHKSYRCKRRDDITVS